MSAEVKLWRAVLEIAKNDLIDNDNSIMLWVETDDFEQVCANAGIESKTVKNIFRKIDENRNDD